MKQLMRWIFLILIVAYPLSSGFAEQTIRLTTGEWAPFISKELKHGGVVLHIITDVFDSVGVKVDYGFYPWVRARYMAQDGEWDGTAIWGVSSEREKYFYYSDLVMTSPYVFFHLKSFPFEWDTWDDLAGIPMGGLTATDYGKEFKRLEAAGKMNVQWVPTDLQNFKKLLSGRIKVVPLELDVGYHIIRSHFTPEEASLFTHHPKADVNAFYHLLLSKNNKNNIQMLTLFNKGLRHFRAIGKYDAYFENFRKGKYESNQP
jgi:polar amino acid transport system substrate-binding protein